MSTERAETPLLAEGRNLILIEEAELPEAERPRSRLGLSGRAATAGSGHSTRQLDRAWLARMGLLTSAGAVRAPKPRAGVWQWLGIACSTTRSRSVAVMAGFERPQEAVRGSAR
jgi:hypothetical protein